MVTETEVVELTPDDFQAGVTAFLDSPGWVYLTHRYPIEARGPLLRLLTLSGLDSWAWESCTMHLVTQRSLESLVVRAMRRASRGLCPAHIPDAVAEIRTYAEEIGVSLGEPPLAPRYLSGYGYTQAAYVADLQRLYGPDMAARYAAPWPEVPFALQKPFIRRDVLLRPGVAMMGATARAIEWLMAQGDNQDD
jgi:hypothetical protein